MQLESEISEIEQDKIYNIGATISRNEHKFKISQIDRLNVISTLREILEADFHSVDGCYKVRSLYFDTVDNKDFMNKVNGVPVRKKIRLRIYDITSDFVKFEIKSKYYKSQKKQSMRISKEDTYSLIKGDYNVLLKYNNDIGKAGFEIMSKGGYRPVSMVQYNRMAFTHKDFNTRVTIDNNILYSMSNFDLFSGEINFNNAFTTNENLLEIKYSDHLMYPLVTLLSNCVYKENSPSKFASSRKLLKEFYN